MPQQRPYTRTVFLVTSLLLFPTLVFAGEEGKASDETAAQVRQAIESYVKKDMALKESFLLRDPQTGQPMSLMFDQVHQGVEKVNGEYVACVDFQREGKTYDVDFFVQPHGGQWEISRIRVHKVDGKALAPQE